jgi:hypothetical protein
MGRLVRPPHRTDTERGTRLDSAHAFAAAVTELATTGNSRRMLVQLGDEELANARNAKNA